MGFMGSAAYIAAMLIIICTNDSKPNNAAYILLFYDTLAIFAFFRSYNPPNHFLFCYTFDYTFSQAIS